MSPKQRTYPTEPSYCYRVNVAKVVDADTIDVDIDLGCHVWIRRRLRLLEVNAWETRGPEREKGLVAKARVADLLANAHQVLIETEMDDEGKYGRLLAHVYCAVDEPAADADMVERYYHINSLLIEEGHGR